MAGTRETAGFLAGHVADGLGHTIPAECCRCTNRYPTVREIQAAVMLDVDDYTGLDNPSEDDAR